MKTFVEILFFSKHNESCVNMHFITFITQTQSESLCWVYSVQIRDVGRFLAKFNPWTNTFGNRLVRLHCSRIHPSVKLSTPKVYTCILMVAVSWKISVLNYWRWIWSAQIPCLKYIHTCSLNTHVYLQLYSQTPICDNEIYNDSTFIVL